MWTVLRKYQIEESKTLGQKQIEVLSSEKVSSMCVPNTPHFRAHKATTSTNPVDLSLRTIAMHETKPYVDPPPPSVLTAPFDRRVYGKIATHLCHEQDDMRFQAMVSLLDLYQARREHVVWSLKPPARMLHVLACDSLQDPCEDLRAQACVALVLIAREAEGQHEILRYPVIQENIVVRGVKPLEGTAYESQAKDKRERAAELAVRKADVLTDDTKLRERTDFRMPTLTAPDKRPLLPIARPDGRTCASHNMFYIERFLAAAEDESDNVRAEALLLLIACHCAHNDYLITKHLIKLGCIKLYTQLILQYSTSHAGVSGNACIALNKALDIKIASVEAIQLGAINALISVIKNEAAETYAITEAVECLTKIALSDAGRRAAFEAGALKHLMRSIGDPDVCLRAAVAGSIAAITLHVPARLEAIELGLIDAISEALRVEDERDAIANHLHTVCNIAESPKGQQMLRESVLPRVSEVVGLSTEYPKLHALAENTLRMLEWKPGDARI